MIKSSIETENGTEYKRQLSGVPELLDVARTIEGSPEDFKMFCASTEESDHGYKFTQTRSLGEAIRLCAYGWPEGRERIKSSLQKVDIEDVITHFRREVDFTYETAGDEPDVDRYLSGEPENMMEFFVESATKGKVAQLFVNASQPALMPPEVIMRRGVAIAVAADVLTATGYSLGIEMIEKTTGHYRGHYDDYSSDSVEYRIPLIEPGSSFDIDTIAFCTTHPSFLRRLILALNESEPKLIRDSMGYWSSGGYGMPECARLGEEEIGIVIDKDDGLLKTDSLIVPYAKELAKRLIGMMSEEN